MKKNKLGFGKIFVIAIVIYMMYAIFSTFAREFTDNRNNTNTYNDKVFSLITTPENKVLENIINKHARKMAIDINITYADNLDIVDKLNSGEKYDAIWASNSIWLDMLDSNKVSTSDSKSTSVTPIVIGIKYGKAKELNLINRQVKMKDILSLIKSGKLKFSMANPITTNSGAASYLNILSTLAGNPDVLTSNHLKNKDLQADLKSFFTGLVRTSGDEDFLNKSFVDGDYDAAITYESSIININKELVKNKKEALYVIYPVDGVSICDSPLVYINNHNDRKKKIFNDLQSFILSDEGQDTLLNLGRCLDYSGSMYGDGMDKLQEAMEYILSDEAKKSMIQFTGEDIIDVIAFGSHVNILGNSKGNDTNKLLEKIKEFDFDGATALYPAATKAIELLSKESNNYNTSVILMTDGEGNIGTFKDLEETYKKYNREIPIYSITFGDANVEQLNNMAKLSNGKVFDGRYDLTTAFKTVRGYN